MKSIREFLMEHAALDPVSFHMPGHKGSRIYKENGYGSFLENIIDCDITEIPGADNLFQAEDIIAETMKKYKNLYDAEQSYLLVNGSSGGLIAAVLASVRHGGKLVMARNCHKSLFNVLALGDIEPVYAFPETEKEYGILGEVTAAEIARCLDENPDADAVVLPSPNYYGICSDVTAIAEEVHKRGKILIVDQAHGAHLKFFEKFGDGVVESCRTFPKSAESSGADLVINSVHKTLASFTQSAVLNLCSDRVNKYVLEDKLQTIESSSPSYPMMASLDINADLLADRGAALMKAWADNLDWFYEEAKTIPGLRVMDIPSLDRTKLNIDMSAYGINGNQLEEMLMEKGIFVELVTGNIVMCMTGIGNRREDFQRLIDELRHISTIYSLLPQDQQKPQPAALTRKLGRASVPRTKVFVPVDEAEGRVCASSIIPYPPGIPMACPGDVIDREVIEYVKARRAAHEKVIGLNADGTVTVGE